MRVILRSPNWIGDCIMSIPAIRSLKEIDKTIEIVLLTKNNLKNIFINMDEISGFITLPEKKGLRNIFKLIRNIRKSGIKTGILFTNTFLSALIFRLAGVKKLTGYKRELRGFLLTKKISFPKENIHQEDFYLDLISLFSGKKTKKIPINSLILTKSEKVTAVRLLKKLGIDRRRKIIGISPYSAYGDAKEWPENYFSNLIRKFSLLKNTEIILFGAPSDYDRLNKIGQLSKKKIYNVSSGFSLREAILVMSKLNLFIGNDSGLMHIASSLSIPIAAIFGPTLPQKSFPRRGDNTLFYKKVLCSPCSFRECPTDHKCMMNIKVEDVYNSVLEKLR